MIVNAIGPKAIVSEGGNGVKHGQVAVGWQVTVGIAQKTCVVIAFKPRNGGGDGFKRKPVAGYK